MKTIAIIPARSGSKSLKDKNIRIMNGKPMLAYSIEHALQAKTVDRVFVSTDSEMYRDIALEYGAEAPFLRPAELSGDSSLDIEVFQHFLEWLQKHEGFIPDICVHLRPTHPVRKSEDIDQMVGMLKEDDLADSVRSLSEAKQTPYKMWFSGEGNDGYILPVIKTDISEAYNSPRQLLPKAYLQNACIDVVRSSTILRKCSMTGDHIRGFIMEYDYDIDSEEDFLRTERALLLHDIIKEKRQLRICCDIDGVVATKTSGNNYSLAMPMSQNIETINHLVELGHYVILHTARGSATGIDWCETTRSQMKLWDVKYQELIFKKPSADIYIDDKFFELSELKQLLTRKG